jgi:hypothetical protein
VEYDRWRVAINYFKTWFFIDAVSGVPFAALQLLIEATHNGGITRGDSENTTGSSLSSAKSVKFLRFLKLGRIFKIEKILSNLDRDTYDRIEDFMQSSSTRTGIVFVKLFSQVIYILILSCLRIYNIIFSLCFVILKSCQSSRYTQIAYVCHLMACGMVALGRYGTSKGMPSWFETDIEGPFVAEDTTGTNGDREVYSLYIAAFYFSLTSMSCIGYGDITAQNNVERLYVIGLEFVAIIIFSYTIANITFVVTFMNANARKTAEQLDSVNSFVQVRNFPQKMGRKIIRHFRDFYRRQRTIDEAKLFAELSTGLRKEVSSYLVENLLGKESFFVAMPSNLWPRLLPLLKPTGFKLGELVCTQGEDCAEMFVVVSGILLGECYVVGEPKPRKRNICIGASVNSLHVLNVWHKCIETVVAKEATETYAMNARDIDTLFLSDSDMLVFDTIQARELQHFKTDFLGKPLYFSCFTTVEVSLAEVTGRFRRTSAYRDLAAKSNEGSGSEAYLVVDLVDRFKCKPFNGLWRHTTARTFPTPAAGRSLEEDTFANEAVREAFKQACLENNQEDLNQEQFKELVKKLMKGVNSETSLPPDKDLDAAFILADEDKGGTVDEDEFLELYRKVRAGDVSGFDRGKGWGHFSFLFFGNGQMNFVNEYFLLSETVKWDDVNVPFGQAAVRVRLFLAHCDGRPAECVGKVLLLLKLYHKSSS